MSKNDIGKGKTNKHKNTLKAHIRSQVASAAPKAHGKAQAVTSVKRRAK